MSKRSHVTIRIDEIKKETEAAFLCEQDETEFWLPKSQIEEDCDEIWEGRQNVFLTIPKWLADEKGCEYE